MRRRNDKKTRQKIFILGAFLLLAYEIFCHGVAEAERAPRSFLPTEPPLREEPLRGAENPPFGGEITFMTWNLQNLFDAEDDPQNDGDDEFLPPEWTDGDYREKLAALAKVIARVKPDILGVAEVENRRVLKDLTALLRKKYGVDLPYIVHRDSADQRGIDCALLSRFAPTQSDWIIPGSYQREMPVAIFELGDSRIAVIENHWKSRLGDTATSDGFRRRQSRLLANYVRKNKNTAIIAMGDFNCDDDSEFITPLPLTNLWSLVPADTPHRGSYFYFNEKRWNTFDQILVSPELFPLVVSDSFTIVRTPENCTSRSMQPLRFRPGKGGASDHFPVSVKLNFR